MADVLSGPKLKIKRAKHHINDLQVEIAAFLKTNFYSLRVDEDAERGGHTLKLEMTKAVPDNTALIIGDAIHNLRSALDLLVSDIVGGKTRKGTNFPIRDSRNELVGIVKSGPIHQADPSLCDLIVDVIKPYAGGNDPLLALHELDIIDKHRLLIPVVQVTALSGVHAEDERHNTFHLTMTVDHISHTLNAVRTHTKLKIKNYGQPSFEIFFDEGLPMEGEPIIPTLHQFSDLVSGIIRIFEGHCFGIAP